MAAATRTDDLLLLCFFSRCRSRSRSSWLVCFGGVTRCVCVCVCVCVYVGVLCCSVCLVVVANACNLHNLVQQLCTTCTISSTHSSCDGSEMSVRVCHRLFSCFLLGWLIEARHGLLTLLTCKMLLQLWCRGQCDCDAWPDGTAANNMSRAGASPAIGVWRRRLGTRVLPLDCSSIS